MRRAHGLAIVTVVLGFLAAIWWWGEAAEPTLPSTDLAREMESTGVAARPAALEDSLLHEDDAEQGGLEFFITAAGSPVGDVEVRLYRHTGTTGAGSGWAALRGRTDASGILRLALPSGTYAAYASSADGLAARLLVERPSGTAWTRVTLSLIPTVPLEGVVVDVTTGQPVSNATVALTPRLGHRDARGRAIAPEAERHQVQTDAEGRFALAGLMPGAWRLDVQAAGFAPLFQDRLLVPTPSPLRLELTRSGFLRGFVQDARGTPVADARVWVDGTSEADEVVTGVAGEFSLEVSAGLYRLHAKKAGAAATLPTHVTVHAGQTLSDLLLVLKPASGLQVQVAMRGTGQPVGTCQIAVHQGRERHEARCDGEGRALVEGLAPGLVTVEVTAPGFAPQRVENVRLLDEERFSLRVELATSASVQGRVTTPRGQPVVGAWVRTGNFWGSGNGGGREATTTDAEGRFLLQDVPPGALTVRAWKEPASMGISKTVSVLPGQIATVDLELEESGVLQGRVSRQDGAPLHPDTTVRSRPRGRFQLEGSHPLKVQPDGTYRLELPAGVYNVNAARMGSRVWSLMSDAVPVEVHPGETVQLDLVVATEPERCAVRVLEPGGAPAMGARVQVDQTTTGTGDEGAFLWSFPGGAMPAEVQVRNGGRFVETQIDSCEDVVQLQEPARLTGMVGDASGRPVEGFTLTWGLANAQRPQEKRVASVRFSGARFELDEVPGTALQVEVVTDDGRHGSGSVSLRPGADGRLDVTLEPAARIEGRVLSARTGRPILGAQVHLGLSLPTVHVDDDGGFASEPLPPGTYRVVAEADGYLGRSQKVVLARGEVASLGSLQLEELRVEPGSIGATATSRGEQVYLAHLLPNGPADRAGVQEWDALLAIDDVPVDGLRDAAMRLQGAPGTLVRLRLLRGGLEQAVEVARQP